MRRSIIVFLFGLLSIYSRGQEPTPGWQYLDKYHRATEDSTRAAYFRAVIKKGDGFIVRDYYISRELERISECIEIEPRLVMHGTETSFYKNGGIKETGRYSEGNKTGLFKSYYESGSRMSEVYYDGDKTKYLNFWNETGEAQLNAGSGHVVEERHGAPYYSEIVDSVLVNTYTIEPPADTVYVKLEKLPEYDGGYERLLKHISKTLTYPRAARRNDIEGTVYVSFIIDKRGRVINPIIRQGIDPECDEEARFAVSKLKPWTPGMVHGKPVSVRFNLPVKFRLH